MEIAAGEGPVEGAMPTARNGTERQAGAVGVPAEIKIVGRENLSLDEPTGVNRCMNEDSFRLRRMT